VGAVQPPTDARNVTVAAARLRRWLDGFTERHGATEIIAASDVVALTGADGARAWVEVPFPPLEVGDAAAGARVDPLVDHVERTRRVGVLLVRRGGHASGIFAGGTLVASKVGSSYVQGTTKAGGWSQQRYARRRDNQAKAAASDGADIVGRLLLPEVRALKALIAGGDRTAVDAILTERHLAPVAALRAERLLDVPEPRLTVLVAAIPQARAVLVLVRDP
jgi:hypothetical protein